MSEEEIMSFLYSSIDECLCDLFWKHPEINEEYEREVMLAAVGAVTLNVYLRFNLPQDEVREELRALFSAFIAEYNGGDGNG